MNGPDASMGIRSCSYNSYICHKLMSHLIDSLGESETMFNEPPYRRQSMNLQSFRHYLKNLPSFSETIKCFQSKNQKSDVVLELQLLEQLPSVIQRIHINRQRFTLQSTFVLKDTNGYVVCCPTNCLRLMIIHELESLRKKMKTHSYCIVVDLESGQILGKHIFSIAADTNICELLMYELVPLRQQLSRVLSIILSLMNQIPPMYNEYVQEKVRITNEVAIEDRIQKRIYRYFSYSSIQICKSYSQAPSESLEQPEDRDLLERLQQQIPAGFQEESSQIFVHRPRSKFVLPFKYSFTEYEFSNIKIHLKPPPMQSKRSQSNFVFSEVKVLQQVTEAIDTGRCGASTKIMLAKLRVVYLNSISLQQNHNRKEMIAKQYTRLMGIKVPLEKTSSQKAKKKSEHQIKILKLFSDAQSPFLLRYFVSNTPTFKFNNMLMMNFNNTSDTLSSFLNKKRETISLNSKLYVLINLLQALRLIKDYGVVHMDLSPSNVLVNSNYIAQLIDFGESYHIKICGKDYNPGYTLPFSFPEKFSQYTFTNKSDMFSFGVLVLFSIFKSLPYFPSARITHSLKNFRYLQKFFFAPESLQYYGYRKLMVFLFSFIQRCIDPFEVVRPHPSWSIILLKQLYYWIEQVSITM